VPKPIFTENEREGGRFLLGGFVIVAIIGAIVFASLEALNLKDTGEETFAKECPAHGGTVDGVRCTVQYGSRTYDLPIKNNRFDDEQAGWAKENCDRERAEGRSNRWHADTGVCESIP